MPMTIVVRPIPPVELFNQTTQEFFYTESKGPKKPVTLHLEHSLISVFRWEGHWPGTPFLTRKEKTKEQWLDYIACMSIDKEVDKDTLEGITTEQFQEILKYIQKSQTATTINNRKSKNRARPETMTAELMYYYIGEYNLPISAEKWHLSRLLALINVANVKSSGGNNKMSRKDIYAENKAICEANRKRFHTRG